MPAADEPTARVPAHCTPLMPASCRHEGPRLSLLAEAQLLVGDQLRDGEAVVDLGDVDVPGPDARHAIRALGRALERRPVGIVLVERRELEAVERLAGI